MIQLRLAPGPAAEADADAVVVTAFDDSLSAAARRADAALDGALAEMRDLGTMKGAFAERTVLRTFGRLPARRILVLGLGPVDRLDSFRLHNAYQLAGSALRAEGVRTVVADCDQTVVAALAGAAPDDGVTAADAVRAIATGLSAGDWTMPTSKTDDAPEPPGLSAVEVAVAGDGSAVAQALEEAAILAETTNAVRAWVATPSNRLTPTALAQSARELLDGTGVEVDVLDRAELERERMGALLGVARGSDEPPVMIVARWEGGGPGGARLGLVGKGITFDTGGISLKPPAGMEHMKTDMGGGAAVLGAMRAIGRLGVAANVVAVVPATENMPGGRAYKPGDVLRSRLGKTIEVVNTDAEGRVVLADGLAWARELGATHLVDVATLTGGVIAALGHVASGLMSNDDDLSAMVQRAARRAGDRVWELPMFPEYDVCLHSEVADMKNVGSGREAQAIAGAVFVREFVGSHPWVHLDIAGTSWNNQTDLAPVPKGPSGAPVRTLVALAQSFAQL